MRSIHALACLRKGMVYFSGAFACVIPPMSDTALTMTSASHEGPDDRARVFQLSLCFRLTTALWAARENVMSSRCDVCRRTSQYGHSVSHSNRKTNRRFLVNIQRRRLVIDGTPRNVHICTRCLRTMMKVEKSR